LELKNRSVMSETESVYVLLNPNPAMKAMRRADVAILLTALAIIAVLAITQVITPTDAAWGIALVVGMLIVVDGAQFGWMVRRKPDQAVLTPTALLIRGARPRRVEEYPWRDVLSVGIEKWGRHGWWGRIQGTFSFHSGGRPYVKVVLSREPRLSLLGGRRGTRLFGVFVPGLKTLGLFVEEPDKLVAEAQAYLSGIS
jgi:hypothetical protein